MPNFSGMWTERQQMQAAGASIWPSVPGAPTIGTAIATSVTTASVGFTAPSYTGYPAGITSYTVTSSPGGITATGASSPITVSGLTTGTAYTFTVTATNASGTGPSSAASNSVSPAIYIEDVFSTYLYAGNSSTQTITNGIDLAGEGGMVWRKARTYPSSSGYLHKVMDTLRGTNKFLDTAATASEYTAAELSSFNSDGFTMLGGSGLANQSGDTYASWTFRKQPKFFDVVTYTGNGTAGRTVAHNLGAVPGCMIIKRTDSTSSWYVYHRSLGNTVDMALETTAAQNTATTWNNTTPTSTEFTLSGSRANVSGATFVAYIFAHDAGGFGLTGSDNVISCGSYTCDASNNFSVNLGWEPQWILHKRANSASSGDWFLIDNMRGMPVQTSAAAYLSPNLAAAEATGSNTKPNATGFSGSFLANSQHIYIAIRRGPMKVPTDATKVFTSLAKTGVGGGQTNTTGFPADLSIDAGRATNYGASWFDRLRGQGPYLVSTATSAEGNQSPTYYIGFDSNTSVFDKNYGALAATYIDWLFRRAPSFFDEVCYTGNATTRTISHNLGVAPELIITKTRSTAENWGVYHSLFGSSGDYLFLNLTTAKNNDSALFTTTPPTSSVFSVGTAVYTNENTATMVAYLFATCAGVSKVGSYTGTGTTKQVDCGFAAGARFVLIKRTDSTGDWYVWDSARGIIAGNDPYLLLNSAASEATSTDYIDTHAAGFELSSTAPAAINASGGTYIFLAIA